MRLIHGIMKTFLIIFLATFFLVGCGTNKYEEKYSVISDGEYIPSKENPKLIEIISKRQLNELMRNDGYILIGKSYLYDTYIPRTFAVDCAKKYGASLIAFEQGKGEIIEYDSIDYVPTTSTTYFYGDVYGTATTHGSVPIPVKRHMVCYPQTAYFFAKREFNNSFGISFQLPENIPGSRNTTVRVSAVRKGSQAEKNGIKKNDIIKSINGETISSSDDVMPYVKGEKAIKTIKVSHE